MSLIIEMLQNSCRVHKNKAALRHKVAGRWVEHTYESLWNMSDRVAAGLDDWGLVKGDRAAILAPSSPAWVGAYLGVLKCNAIAVPVDKELKQAELKHILSDCGARILFTEQSYVDMILDLAESLPELEKIVLLNHVPSHDAPLSPQAEQALAALVADWHRLGAKYSIHEKDISKFEQLAEGFHQTVLPAPYQKDAPRKNVISRLLHSTEDKKTTVQLESIDNFQKNTQPPRLVNEPGDPAVILYTSGTTGRSKGAMLSHNNISSNVKTAIELFKLKSDMHTLSFLPINHVFEQVAGIILPLAVGGTVSFAESIRKLGDNLAEVRPNFLLGVPAVFRLLADKMSRKVSSQKLSKALFSFPVTKPLVTKKVREAFGGNPVFISGGAALDPAVQAQLMKLGLKVFQGYGITETSPVIAVETPQHNRLGTVGLPMSGVEVKIHEPNSEGVGEIWAKGPNIMLGYYNNPNATAESITDGWYHTGDLGCIEEEGYLKICGRLKNLIVTANGKNVYPEEVENEISNSFYISEIMVYGHKVNNVYEEVHAMIYPDPDALDQYAQDQGIKSLTSKDIESLIKQEVLERGKNLADYKKIKRFTLRQDEFPKTTTRKIKRFAVEANIEAEG